MKVGNIVRYENDAECVDTIAMVTAVVYDTDLEGIRVTAVDFDGRVVTGRESSFTYIESDMSWYLCKSPKVTANVYRMLLTGKF